MNTTNGGLHFEADLSNEKLEKKLDEAYNKIDTFAKDVEGTTSKIDESFSKAGGNFAKELSEGIKQLGIDTKLTGKELKDTLKNADDFVKGMEVGLREAVKLNAQLAEEIGKLPEGFERDTLAEEWSRMNVEIDDAAAGIEELRKYISDVKYESADLSTQFNRAKAEMEQLVLQGEKGSPKYQALVQEAENLKTAMESVKKEVEIISDPSGMQGFISVLTAASGVAASAAGVMGLFGEKSEQVAVITEKINSIMAIAVGLQNISTQGLTALTAVSNFFAGAQTRVATALNISAASARLFLGAISGGLLLVLPVLITYLQKWYEATQINVKAQKELQDAISAGLASTGEEITKLKLLYDAATDAANSTEHRDNAVRQLQEAYPAYFANIDSEVIKNGEAEGSYNRLTVAIQAAAKARALEGILAKRQTDLFLAQEQKRKERDEFIRAMRNSTDREVSDGNGGIRIIQGDADRARNRQKAIDAEREAMELEINFNKENKTLLKEINGLRSTSLDLTKKTAEVSKPPRVSQPIAKASIAKAAIIQTDKGPVYQEGSLADLRAELSEIQTAFENTNDELLRDMLNVRKGMVEGQIKAIEDRYKVEEDGNKKLLDDFMKAHQSFEQQKTEITDRYSKIREGIESSNISSEEKTRLLASAAEEEGKEISNAFSKGLQDNPEWVEAFGNIEVYTVEKLKNLRELLVTQLGKMNANGAAASDIKAVQDQIIKIDALINRNDNPFDTIAEGFRKMGDEGASMADKLAGAKQAMEGVYSIAENLNQIIDSTREIFTNLGGDVDSTFGDILSNLNQTVDGLVQFGEGATQAMEGFASGNMLQAAAGAIKAISGLVKAVSGWLNGDKRTERAIQEQARLINELKTAYDQLAFAAERAIGAQKYDAQKDLIANLQAQKIAIEAQLKLEQRKKQSDKEKLQGYKDAIQDINNSIIEIQEGIVADVLQNDLPNMAKSLGDALVDAFARGFGKGEEGIEGINSAFDDMIQNILRNQLNLVLQTQLESVRKNLLKAAGFNEDGTGSFNGFTQEEIDDLKSQWNRASEEGKKFIEAYKSIFENIDPDKEQGLRGEIKGVTEKTAGALEAQMNAIRINQAQSLLVLRDSLLQLVRIAENTQNLVQIRKDIAELNAKTIKPLAGI